jgi:hypothetical protein
VKNNLKNPAKIWVKKRRKNQFPKLKEKKSKDMRLKKPLPGFSFLQKKTLSGL